MFVIFNSLSFYNSELASNKLDWTEKTLHRRRCWDLQAALDQSKLDFVYFSPRMSMWWVTWKTGIHDTQHMPNVDDLNFFWGLQDFSCGRSLKGNNSPERVCTVSSLSLSLKHSDIWQWSTVCLTKWPSWVQFLLL